MSYMSPSYLIQSQFDTSWTPLAKRYSLLLYREVGWEDDEVSFVFVLPPLGPNEQPSSLAGSQSSSSPEMLALLTRSVQ
jgi:GPI inositol-deacylase